jgi:hypothetical protein
VITTQRDEVEMTGLLEALQSSGHVGSVLWSRKNKNKNKNENKNKNKVKDPALANYGLERDTL